MARAPAPPPSPRPATIPRRPQRPARAFIPAGSRSPRRSPRRIISAPPRRTTARRRRRNGDARLGAGRPPSGGDAAALNNASALGAFSAGSATGTTFNWPEVGIITLTPGVANYLGSGAVTGTASGNVGRFYPNGFAVALNTPVFGTACAAGGFSYLGQPLTYTVAPVATATAQALGGATTRNYTGAFMKITNALADRPHLHAHAREPSLNVSGLPATDGRSRDRRSGHRARPRSPSAPAPGLLFNRGARIAPFNANIALGINVIDTDGVVARSTARRAIP